MQYLSQPVEPPLVSCLIKMSESDYIQHMKIIIRNTPAIVGDNLIHYYAVETGLICISVMFNLPQILLLLANWSHEWACQDK